VIGENREVTARSVGWSILDCAYSPDSKWLAYTSWSSSLHLVNAMGEVETHESIEVDDGSEGRFGVFSVQFDLNSTQVCLRAILLVP
jgi:hypothetical protein